MKQSVKVKARQQEARMLHDLAFLFDTETTGLIFNRTLPLDKQPEIIEFYGCLADLVTGKVFAEIDTLVLPSSPIPAEATNANGITNEMVKGAPQFRKVAPQIKAMIEQAPLIIAHNLSFDVEMVEIDMERVGLKIAWPRKLCTVEQTLHLKGFRLSLSALHEYLFGEAFSGAHRAKVDVEAMLRCCVELKKRDII
jgi:DNA polymerase III alpha subunit (gram-positive type)